MSDKFENLINAGKGVSLRADEKLALDEKIKAHVQANPVISLSISASSSYALPLIIAGLVAVGGIVALVSSQSSLPSSPEQVSNIKLVPTSTDLVPKKQSDQKQAPTITTASSSNTLPVKQWPGQGRDASQ